MLTTTIKLSLKLNGVISSLYITFNNICFTLKNKNKPNAQYTFLSNLIFTYILILFPTSRLCAQPVPPSNLYVISQNQTNELYWNTSTSPGVTEYRIYRSEDSINFSYITTVFAPDTTYTDNGLTNGTFYFYRIKAFDGTESIFSNTDASTPQALLGRYLEFDGVDDYLVIDDSSDYMLQMNMSLEIWFRAEDVISDQFLLDRVSHKANAHPYNILLRSGTLMYRRAGDNTYYNISTIDKGTWYHLAVTRDANYPGTINFYINGILTLTLTGYFSSNESYYSPCVLAIGAQTSSNGSVINYSTFFDGQIAEFRMWNKTLTPAEINNNMNIPLRGDETDLLALFHLDDIYNTTVYNYTSVLRNAVAVGGPVSYTPLIKANNENLSIKEDETNHHFNIKANDTYGASSKIRTEIIDEPDHGTAKVINKDSILYTPFLNYNGYDTIRYVLVDTTVFGVDPYIYSDTAFLYITVTPVNDPPVITSNGGGTTANISIVENSDSITTVTATDIDIPAQTISYSISAGVDKNLFSIDSVTGRLSFLNAPDYENPIDSDADDIYNVQVLATDNGTGSLTDFQNIKISVTNINEPVIIMHAGGADSAFVNTKENIYNDSITTITAFDPENSFGVYISGGPDKGRFTIDIARVLKMKYPSANFENPDDANGDGIFEVWVTASDGYTPNADTQKIFVQILDENDAPVITSHGGALVNMLLDENKTIVDTIYVEDEDIPSQTFTYSINTIVDHACFTINYISDTSAVLMFTNPPNHESPDDSNSDNIYITQLNVSDGNKNTTQAYIITILNVNDKPNITSNGGGINAAINVNENISAVTTVTATDEDTPAQNLIFFISGGSDSSRFNIIPQTGVLTFKSIPNFEIPLDDNTDNIYNVTVSVSDGIDTTSQDIAVTIIDIDESLLFITTWQTTTINEQITVPTSGGGHNFSINWGDGTEDTAVTSDVSHTYSLPGVYTVSTTGDLVINFYDHKTDAEKLLTVEQWGNIAWASMNNAFLGCSNLRINATDAPDLSNVTSMSSMFRGCSSFNDSIDHWDVSNVTSMTSLFKGATSFNQPLDNWDVSKVKNMESMFENTTSFDQPLNTWDVSSVKNMYGMFRQTDSFNQDIGGWDVSNVTTMYTMFREARSFNQDISSWDMSNVTDISNMFYKASAFDQNLGKWQFNKDVKIPYNTFKGCGINCDNYSAALQEWASNPTITDSVKLSAADLTYGSHAIISRNKLITEKGWTITDDFLGKGTNDCTPANRPFVTIWKSDTTGVSFDNQISIPTNGTGYEYYVHWEDITDKKINGMLGPVHGDTTITFPSNGIYRITIVGDFPCIYFNNGGDRQKLLEIEQWGDNEWTNLDAAFYGCCNLKIKASDIPNLNNVTSLTQMFRGASSLDYLTNPNWDVSNVLDMSELFFDASNFNGSIGNWDVRNVQNMTSMFQGALSFNQPIGNWNLGSVQYLDSLFSGAQAFNQPINDWNLNSISSQGINYIFQNASSFDQPLDKWGTIIGARITQLNGVFKGASSFNQPIEDWDVSNITSMDSLFANAQAFNQPLNNWDVSNVISMNAMFRDASAFNQYLGNWKSNATQRHEMLNGTNIDCTNYGATLKRWVNNTTAYNVVLGAQGLEYGISAADAVNELVNNRSWTISGHNASVSECILFEIDHINDTVIHENAAYTSIVPSITGIPIDSVVYILSNGADIGLFTINETTGVVSLTARDYESPDDSNTDNIYELEITATDVDGNTFSQSWTVTVRNVIETATLSVSAISDTSVNENSGYTSVTPSITGTPIGDIVYRISGGNDATDFTIDTITGIVSMVARNYESPVDNNTNNIYEIEISVTDSDGNTDTEEWTVTVKDVIETSTLTIGAIADTSVDENNGYTSVTPSIIGMPIGNIVYSISGGDDATDFTIDTITGVVNMMARDYESPVDNNIDNIYDIEIKVTDSDGNTDTEEWTITVKDVIESATFTINAISDTSVNENDNYTSVTPSIIGTPIGDIVYSISGGIDSTDFTIDSITGVVNMVARDYESPVDNNIDNIYEIEIKATDSNGNTDTENWTVTITDVTEIATFTINSISDTSINENSTYTSVTPSISGSPIANIVYNISGGADATHFTINTSTGVISMVERDYENPIDANSDNIFEIEITVTDDDGNTASKNLKITIADENEGPTDISLSTTTVGENKNDGAIVGYFTSTDEDSAGSYSYTLVTGTGDTDNGSFQISGNELLTSAIFDYESKDTYYVRIRTTDNGTGSFIYEKTFTIEVVDINDAPSGIILDNDHIDEGLPGNTYVGLFNTIDEDPSDNHSYDLVSGEGDTDNSSFKIVGKVLRTSEKLDYANQADYSIRVKTTDNGDGNLTYEQAFTISLNKINNPPSGISISQNNIDENEPQNTEIGLLTSIDPDIGDNHTYNLLDKYDKDFFEITGNILIASESFNFETRNQYSIAIRTTDSNGESFDSTFVITVNDVNDPPFFVNANNVAISFVEYSLEAYDSLTLCPKIFDEDDDVTSYISMQVINNNGNFKEDPENTGCLIFIPDTSYRGMEDAILVISDNSLPALTDTLLIRFTITEPYINYPPVIADEFNSPTDTLYYVTFVNEAVNVCINAYDPNDDAISISGILVYEGAAEAENPLYPEMCFEILPATDFIGQVYANIILQDNGYPVLSDTTILSLLVEPKLEFSQAISPNDDGIADYLHISGIEKFPNNNLTIFNRWGDIVYHQENYNNQDNIWDGQPGGGSQGYVPDGTYFYLLEIEGLKKQIKGYLVLKRKSHE